GRVSEVLSGIARVQIAGSGDILATAGDAGVVAGSNVDIFVRPEAISIGASDTGNQLAVTVDSLLFNGASSRVLVRTNSGAMIEVLHNLHDGAAQFAVGDKITISFA